MKKLMSLVFVIGILFGSAKVFAGDFSAPGCTLDRVAVLLPYSLEDNDPRIRVHINTAFAEAAKRLTFEKLKAEEGWELFISGLTAEDVDDLTAVSGPTTDGSSCKIAS